MNTAQKHDYLQPILIKEIQCPKKLQHKLSFTHVWPASYKKSKIRQLSPQILKYC